MTPYFLLFSIDSLGFLKRRQEKHQRRHARHTRSHNGCAYYNIDKKKKRHQTFSWSRNNVAQGTKAVPGRRATGETRSAYALFKINHGLDQTVGSWTFLGPLLPS